MAQMLAHFWPDLDVTVSIDTQFPFSCGDRSKILLLWLHTVVFHPIDMVVSLSQSICFYFRLFISLSPPPFSLPHSLGLWHLSMLMLWDAVNQVSVAFNSVRRVMVVSHPTV